MEYTYDAEVVTWIDGDTVALHVIKEFDFGFYVVVQGQYESHFRLLGIDTPERGKLNFREATEAAKALAPVGSMVKVKTYKADKYGRYLAEIVTAEGINVSSRLLEMGLAKPYGINEPEIAWWTGTAETQEFGSQ